MLTLILLANITACSRSSSSSPTSDEVTIEDEVVIEDEAEITTEELPPVITLVGDSKITLNQDTFYVELGATALDDTDGAIDVVITGTVNSKVTGIYSILYTATDSEGNEANETRTVIVPTDSTPPVMSLIGNSSVALDSGEVYVELGATATDWRDGEISVVTTGIVNSNVSAEYNITYSAMDSAGNESTLSRVVIIDVADPVITLVGDNPLTIELGEIYTELEANAEDEQDGSLPVAFSGSVDDSTIGVYVITYTATDSAGNIGSATRTVNVVADATAPVITLVGDDEIDWTQNFTYVDLGSSAYDLNDGDITVVTTGTVDDTVINTYVLTFTATDAANNESTKTRTVNVVAPVGFITQWETTTANEAITIPIKGGDYLYTVNWGDGTVEVDQTESDGHAIHTYADAGIHEVTITGNFPRIFLSDLSSSDAAKLLSVEQWGNNQWSSMELAFINASNLNFNAIDSPVLHSTVSMKRMFVNATSFNSDISNWDVTAVTDMYEMFRSASSFNQTVNDWDVSNVTNMENMFRDASSFNQALNDWDVSNVTTMASMLRGTAFNQPLNSWNVSKVTNMDAMFYEAYAFNQDVSDWNITSVTDMGAMFLYSGLSTDNYDALLNEWSSQTLLSNTELDVDAYYSSAGETARQSVIDIYSWTINDEGLVPSVDTEAPVVTLYGGDITITSGDTFIDPGARALDDIDGAIAVDISGDVVDENTIGTYTVIYTATDNAGNISPAKTRTVTVE